jgi:hypothetical protein
MHFRRIKGFHAMPFLMAALETALEKNDQFDTGSEVA